MNCTLCQDTHWVCEGHPDKPMGHDGCKGAVRLARCATRPRLRQLCRAYPQDSEPMSQTPRWTTLSQQSVSDESLSGKTKTRARQISSSAPSCTSLPPTSSRNFSRMIRSRNKR
jgi:hypothetical protein